MLGYNLKMADSNLGCNLKGRYSRHILKVSYDLKMADYKVMLS